MHKTYENCPDWLRLTDMEPGDHYKYEDPEIVCEKAWLKQHYARNVVIAYDADGPIATYDSIPDATYSTGLSSVKITRAIKNKTKAGDLWWRLEEIN